MATGTLRVDLHLPQAVTLKDKRAVVRHLVEGAQSRYRVAAAEVGGLGRAQRAEVEFAAVSGERGHIAAVLDAVERFVWSHPELEVLGALRGWCEEP